MAEIRIERKPRRKAGPLVLIIVALIVILAVWYWQTQVTSVPSTGMIAGSALTEVV